MFAIVEIAGKQYKVTENAKIVTDRLSGNAGDEVEFDRVLICGDDKNVKVGTPTVEGAKVTAKIESSERLKKVLVFKKKRRKGYRKLNGHRQQVTTLRVSDIAIN